MASFKLPARVVRSFPDVQLNFDRLVGWLGTSVLKLATGADLTLAHGRDTVTWPAGSPHSNPMTVTHGLGRTPIRVFTSLSYPLNVVAVAYMDAALGAVTFDLRAREAANASPGLGVTQDFYWVAVG